MKFKVGDRVRVKKVFQSRGNPDENILLTNVEGIISMVHPFSKMDLYYVDFPVYSWVCSEDQMTLIKEATMKDTISLEEAYNAGMCREGMKRFIQIVEDERMRVREKLLERIWDYCWFIPKYIDKLTPEENKWLKDHGYLYKQEHEYKFGDDVEYYAGGWYKGKYVKKDDDGEHMVLDIEQNILYSITKHKIKPAKEA